MPAPIDKNREEPGIALTRRQALAVLAATGGAAALSACGVRAASPSSAPTAEPAPFEGYSIFHETMVELPWTTVEKAAQAGAVVLLPVAVIEEHGPHMSLGVDTFLTYELCKLSRRALESKSIPALVAPPYYWGMNQTVNTIPGSFTVRDSTFRAMLYDLHDCLHGWGFQWAFSFNLHGDTTHKNVLLSAIQEARDGLGMGAYGIPLDMINAPAFPHADRVKSAEYHAGAMETAQMLAYFPHEVDTALAKTLPAHQSFTRPGYYGDPSKYDLFDLNEVRQWAEAVAESVAVWVQNFLNTKKSNGTVQP